MRTPFTPGGAGEFKKEKQRKPPTCPLRPVITNNARPPRITAAAGTEFMLSTGFPRHRLYLHLSCAPCLFFYFLNFFFVAEKELGVYTGRGTPRERPETHTCRPSQECTLERNTLYLVLPAEKMPRRVPQSLQAFLFKLIQQQSQKTRPFPSTYRQGEIQPPSSALLTFSLAFQRKIVP